MLKTSGYQRWLSSSSLIYGISALNKIDQIDPIYLEINFIYLICPAHTGCLRQLYLLSLEETTILTVQHGAFPPTRLKMSSPAQTSTPPPGIYLIRRGSPPFPWTLIRGGSRMRGPLLKVHLPLQMFQMSKRRSIQLFWTILLRRTMRSPMTSQQQSLPHQITLQQSLWHQVTSLSVRPFTPF